MNSFVVGKSYRVKKTFTALRATFREGEQLTYTGSAYSHYDGITGYLFEDENKGGRVYDVYDGEPLQVDVYFDDV